MSIYRIYSYHLFTKESFRTIVNVHTLSHCFQSQELFEKPQQLKKQQQQLKIKAFEKTGNNEEKKARIVVRKVEVLSHILQILNYF